MQKFKKNTRFSKMKIRLIYKKMECKKKGKENDYYNYTAVEKFF